MPHPVDEHVGRKLRLFRVNAGYSQSELGEAVGVRFQQVQKYESGLNRVSASRLWDFARVLEVPIYSFFEGIDGGLHAPGVQRSQFESSI